jgi:hypothetical protein
MLRLPVPGEIAAVLCISLTVDMGTRGAFCREARMLYGEDGNREKTRVGNADLARETLAHGRVREPTKRIAESPCESWRATVGGRAPAGFGNIAMRLRLN